MGILRLAGNVVSGAASRAAAVARRAQEAARQAAEAARRAAEAARRAAAEAARRASQVQARVAERQKDAFEGASRFAGGAAQGAARVTASGARGLVSRAVDAPGSLVDAGRNLTNAGLGAVNAGFQAQGDLVRGVAGAGLGAADRGLQGLQGAAPSFLQGALGAARTGVGAGQAGLEVSNRLQEAVGSGAVVAGHAVTAAAHGALTDPLGAARNVAAFANDSTNLLKVEDRIRELGPGDSYQLQATVDGSVATVAGRLQGTQRITANDDGSYTLSVNGQAGAGLMARMGTGVGPSGSAAAFVNAGATAEFRFEDPARAADAARMFMGPVAGAASGLLDGGPGEALRGATPNPEIFRDNLTAVELSAGVSAELAGQLGVGPEGLSAGVRGKLSGKAEVSARIEFNEGAPNELVLRQSLNLSATGEGSIPGMNGFLGGSGKVVVEERFELPEGMNPLNAVTDLRGSARQLAQSAIRTGQLSVTLTGQGQAAANVGGSSSKNSPIGRGGQLEAQLRLTGKAEDILRSGGLQAALNGEFRQALDLMAPVVQVEASLTPVVTHQTGISVSAGDGVNSVGVAASATTTDRKDPIFEHSGTLEETQQELAAALRQAKLAVGITA